MEANPFVSMGVLLRSPTDPSIRPTRCVRNCEFAAYTSCCVHDISTIRHPALSKSDAKDPDVDFLHHLKADFGPAIVFFGSEDKWFKNGWKPAVDKMNVLGIASVETHIAEGQSHAFFNKQPWKDITLIAADRFLTKLGYLQGEATLSMPKTGETLRVKP